MSGRQKEGNGAVEGSLVSKTEICYIQGKEFLIRSSLNNEYRDATTLQIIGSFMIKGGIKFIYDKCVCGVPVAPFFSTLSTAYI